MKNKQYLFQSIKIAIICFSLFAYIYINYSNVNTEYADTHLVPQIEQNDMTSSETKKFFQEISFLKELLSKVARIIPAI